MEGPPRPASLPVISGRLSLGRRRRRTKLRSCKRRQARCCSSSCSAAAQPWMTQRLQACTLFDRLPWKIHSVAGRSELFQRWNAFFSALKYCWKPHKKSTQAAEFGLESYIWKLFWWIMRPCQLWSQEKAKLKWEKKTTQKKLLHVDAMPSYKC